MLFGSNNQIIGLHIQNLHDSEERVRFDFSNMTLKDCHIENYSSFWDCNYNENTYFVNCYLLGLPLKSKSTLPLSKSHFQDCVKDETFDDAYQAETETIEKTDEAIRQNLTAFFDIFYRRGRLEAHNFDKNYNSNETVKQKYSRIPSKIFALKELIPFLEKMEVIKWDVIKDVKVIKISDAYKADILNALMNGTLSKRINDLIIGLRNLS
jgi:hypothetical protein